MRFWPLVTAALLSVAVAAPLQAASCCGGANGSDGFVLPKWKRGVAGVSVRIEDTQDLRDDRGDRLHAAKWQTTETKLTFGGGYRVARNLQAGVALPLTGKQALAGSQVSRGFGLGDSSLHVRYEIVDEEMCFMRPVSELSWFELKPSLHWVTSVVFPTGRSTAESRDALGADITGRGLWISDTGLEFSKIWGRFGTALQASVGYQTTPAYRWSAGAGVLYFFEFQHSLTLMATHRQEITRNVAAGKTSSATGTTLTWNRMLGANGWWLRASAGQSGALQGRNTPLMYDGGLQIARFL